MNAQCMQHVLCSHSKATEISAIKFMAIYDGTYCTRPASSDMTQTLLVCENENAFECIQCNA